MHIYMGAYNIMNVGSTHITHLYTTRRRSRGRRRRSGTPVERDRRATFHSRWYSHCLVLFILYHSPLTNVCGGFIRPDVETFLLSGTKASRTTAADVWTPKPLLVKK